MKKNNLKIMNLTICLFSFFILVNNSGCGPKEMPKMTEFMDKKNSICTIVIHRSTYSSKDDRPVIKILLDGRKIIGGRMPKDEMPFDKPLSFIKIKTSPGIHTLEMYCEDGRYQKKEILLQPEETRNILLFTIGVDRNEVLMRLLDLGEEP